MITRSANQQGRDSGRPLALVTGASTGLGYELARCCAANGFDLVVCADDPEIRTAAAMFETMGVEVTAVEHNLATPEGMDQVYESLDGRRVEALLVNAQCGPGKAFLDQDFDDIHTLIDTNITWATYLIRRVGREMRIAGHGHLLITSSVAGVVPGADQAIYNASKAFLDAFSFSLRGELKGSGVTVTCLMDTRVRRQMDAIEVALTGFEAMMRGDAEVTRGTHRSGVAIAGLPPARGKRLELRS